MPKSLILQAQYRSKLEERVAAQLDACGIPYDYEGEWVPYDVPARTAKYLPDFVAKKKLKRHASGAPERRIILEAKGRFGDKFGNGAKERQKLILLQEQHPELDIRIVFQRASTPIYKGSKTTYAKWADDHGFLWSDKGTVPAEWIKEMQT